MIANLQCKECKRHFYRRPEDQELLTIAERLIQLATQPVEEDKFLCPDCTLKEIDRWESEGGH